MDVVKSLAGVVSVELTAADPAGALTALRNAGICVLCTVRKEGDISITLTVKRADFRALKSLCTKRGYELSAVRREGRYWFFKHLLHRPVLVVGFVLLLLLTVYLPQRVLFICIEGNDQVPTRLILEKCEDFGVFLGANRREIRSEKLKNYLIEQIPQIQWVGINTAGCVATVSVKERERELEKNSGVTGVSSIVATRDGIVTECTVTRGKALCKVGQAVKAGQMLVSGYSDCGISILAQRAEAEIYAQTERQIRAVIDRNWTSKGESIASVRKYAVIIGKNRINFYKDSGISPSGCDRIYTQRSVILPGGWELPIFLVTETWIYYDSSNVAVTEQEAEAVLSQYAATYLKQQMVAGQIMSVTASVQEEGNALWLDGKYYCHEMIGQIKEEEIVSPYGKFH